jgi:hypothetical protein
MKKLILLVVLTTLGFVGFGILQAKKLQKLSITKSVVISAPQNRVFDMIRYLNNFPKWSPFLAADPSQKIKITGVDGTIGARYYWVGNGGDDVGYQEIMQIDTLGFVGMKCFIDKPFKAQPTFDYKLQRTRSGVEVTQEFYLESSLADAFFLWLFGAVKEMENTNQKGLILLKKSLEA